MIHEQHSQKWKIISIISIILVIVGISLFVTFYLKYQNCKSTILYPSSTSSHSSQSLASLHPLTSLTKGPVTVKYEYYSRYYVDATIYVSQNFTARVVVNDQILGYTDGLGNGALKGFPFQFSGGMKHYIEVEFSNLHDKPCFFAKKDSTGEILFNYCG